MFPKSPEFVQIVGEVLYSFFPKRGDIWEIIISQEFTALTIAEKHTVWPVTGGLLAEIWFPYHYVILGHILTNTV